MQKRWRQLRFWWAWTRRLWRRESTVVRSILAGGWVVAAIFGLVFWLVGDTSRGLAGIGELIVLVVVSVVSWTIVFVSNVWFARRGGWWP